MYKMKICFFFIWDEKGNNGVKKRVEDTILETCGVSTFPPLIAFQILNNINIFFFEIIFEIPL